MKKSATIKQLLANLNQIEAAREKLNSLLRKRNDQVTQLNLRKPAHWGNPPAENLMTLDGKPIRIWIYGDGAVKLEELSFPAGNGKEVSND